MGGYTISKAWCQYVIRHNDKTYSNHNTNMVLKLCSALYPNVCCNYIIIHLKWVGGSVNIYIKCKLVQWRQLSNYICQETWFIIRVQVSTSYVCTMNECALLSSPVTTGKYRHVRWGNMSCAMVYRGCSSPVFHSSIDSSHCQ